MFKALFGRNVNRHHAHALYGAVVARARDSRFYSEYNVPDTFDGRFEMLVMHLFLLHNRLKDEDSEARQVSQLVFDLFIDDMDAALREASVGDQAVPKRIKKMTQVFYGRTGAYEQALAQEEVQTALAATIKRNLFTDMESGGAEQALAGYMAFQAAELADMAAATIIKADAVFAGPLQEEAQYVA